MVLVVAFNRAEMSSSGRMSAIVIARKSRHEKPYCRHADSFTARNLRLLRSKTHIGTGLLSNRSRHCTSDWDHASLRSLLRTTKVTPAVANVTNRTEMV